MIAGDSQSICASPLIATVANVAKANSMANDFFAVLIFRVLNMYKKNASAVSDIIPSTIARVVSPSSHRKNANGDMDIAVSKLIDNNAFSDVVLRVM